TLLRLAGQNFFILYGLSVVAAAAVLHGGHLRGRGAGGDAKPRRRANDAVAVAHPAAGVAAVAEEHAPPLERDVRLSELAGARVRHLAPERGGHGLHAVADAEHGNAEPEEARVDVGRAGLVDRRRPAR